MAMGRSSQKRRSSPKGCSFFRQIRLNLNK
uniref:Uncharacterized protein n=1 Tax=Siphoviridae sp. ct1is2 TaxID=2826273 RepID=A0A8S5NNB0_9CAUD|nr:MAG TPA: hypothetical protein [Siphoviridae sp. ct1is2]